MPFFSFVMPSKCFVHGDHETFCLLNPVDNPTKRSFLVKAPGFMDGMKGNLRILDLACGRGQDILKHPAPSNLKERVLNGLGICSQNFREDFPSC